MDEEKILEVISDLRLNLVLYGCIKFPDEYYELTRREQLEVRKRYREEFC